MSRHLPPPQQAPRPAAVAPVRPIHTPSPEVKQRIASATDLLVRADGIDDRRVQSALTKARKAMTDLAEQVNRYENAASARAEIADLEAQLAAARARLTGGKPRKPRQPKESTVASNGSFQCRANCDQSFTRKDNRDRHEMKCGAA